MSQSPPNIILITHILEKIMGSEQLNRKQHVDYLYYLLNSASNEHLSGLSLDQLTFDTHFDGIQPALDCLSPSRDQKISQYPITWYIQSILRLDPEKDELNRLALDWNIIVLKAAIYLAALPELKKLSSRREDHAGQKETATEYKNHMTTIRRLFEKFRYANNALTGSKNYKKNEEYNNLWKNHLSSPNVSLEDLVSYLKLAEQKDDLTHFEIKLLTDLRVIFSYVLHDKIRAGNYIGKQQVETYYIDEHQQIKEIKQLPAGKSHAAQLEKLSDRNQDRQIQTNLQHVSPLADLSENVKNYLQANVAQHIQRREHNFSVSSLYPNPSSISALLSHLYKDCLREQHNNISLILLLSFVTGNLFSEWIKIQNKRTRRLNYRQTLVEENKQFFIRTRFSIFSDPQHPYPEGFQNHTTNLYIPIPNTFIHALKNNPPVTETEVKGYLNKLREKLFIPQLSLLKVSSLMHHTILNMTGNKQLADILTGIDVTFSQSSSYASYPISTLNIHYVETLKNLCQDLAFQYENVNFFEKDQNFGSIKAPKKHVVKNIFAVLHYFILQQPSQDWRAIYKHYNVWMWHFLLLFTGGRPVRDFPGFLKHWDLQQNILMLSDKEVGGRQGYGRLIPFGDFVKDEMTKFIRFLKHIQRELSFEDQNFAEEIQEILDSKRPLLNIHNANNELEPLRSGLIKNIHLELGLRHDNWHRHTVRAFLTLKIEEPAILALFGHEAMQQEAAHLYSSFTTTEYKTLALQLESMKNHFDIRGINLDGLLD